MDNMVLQRTAEIKKEHQFTKRWQRVVAIICAITVIGTANALILPAITEQTEAYCGHEEHVHSVEAGCYEEKTVLDCHFEGMPHVHTDACYEEHQVLTCGLEESSGHMHSDACYVEKQNLICTLPEDENHTHGSECYETVKELICGLEESEGHVHSEACFTTERSLICGLEEGELEQTHEHTEECYHTELVLVCDKEEHQHTLACFSNPDADVESSAVWERSIWNAALTGEWAHDVLAIADTQLGYTESTRNYIVLDDGVTMKGYTRYGAWYGNAYGDWCAMFCSFCLNYAGVDRNMMPIESSCCRWIEKLACLNLYHAAGSYDPEPGDLVFFAGDTDGNANHVGFVYEISGSMMITIEGNNGPQVAYYTHSLSDGGILGYGELPENPNQPVQAEPEDLFLECSCGAGEGEPHAEDCPIYELTSSEDDEEYFSITSNEIENGVSVTICGPASSFPCPKEEIVVRLTQLTDVNDEIAEAIDEQSEEEAVSELMLFDITLFRGDEEIQPTGPIELRFIGIENNDSENVQTYHIEDEDNINPVETTVDDDGVISVETDHFSLYAVALYNSSGVNVGNHVAITDLDVWLNSHKIIEDGYLVDPEPEFPVYGGLEIEFQLNWAIVPYDHQVNPGDYFTVNIGYFDSEDANAYLVSHANSSLPLTWGEQVVGEGSLHYDEDTGLMSYEARFTWNGISGHVDINGFAKGQFDSRSHGNYSGEVLVGKTSRITPPSGGDPYEWTQSEYSIEGVEYAPIPADPHDYKAKEYYDENQSIDWEISLRELVDEQFSGDIVFSDYMIVEDTLDPYQSFFPQTEEDRVYWEQFNAKGIRLSSHHNLYLVNAAGTGFGGYALGTFNPYDLDVGIKYISANGNNAYIDPEYYGGEIAAEAYVRSHAGTFTVVHTTVNGQPVEKLILNLGKPGVDGYKWSDLSFDQILIPEYYVTLDDICDFLLDQRELCRQLVESHPEAGPNDPISHTITTVYGDQYSWTYSKAQWQELMDMYSNSYAYYKEDPFIYNWRVCVTTYIKRDAEAQHVQSVTNTASVNSASYTTNSFQATASNEWEQGVSMRPLGQRDVFIGKYDAMTGAQFFDAEHMVVTSPIRAAFELYNRDTGQPLSFSQSETAANEYNYDPSGTTTVLWTADNGQLFLRDLPNGRYSLYEVNNDSRYYLPCSDGPVSQFEVTNSTGGTYIGLGNCLRRVVVEKTDAVEPSQYLAGAKFELYRLNTVSGNYEKMKFSTAQDGFLYWSQIGIDSFATDSVGRIDLRGLPSGSYRLKEVEPPMGYELPSGDAVYTYFTLSEYEDYDDLTEATDGGPDYLLVSVENSLEPQNASLTITKNVTFGSQTEPFSFEVTLKDADDQPVPLTPGTYTPSGSDVSYTVATDNTITFTLSHGQSVIIEDIPIGTLATVKETSHAGYNTIVKKGEVQISSSYELTDYEVIEDSEITYYNNLGAELPETGGIGTTPIYALGAMLMAGALMWGCKLRRRRERRAR